MAGTTETTSNAGRLSQQQREREQREREQRIAHLRRANEPAGLASANQRLSKNPTIDNLKNERPTTPPKGQEVKPKKTAPIGTSVLKPQ